jgi:hypothetical protein
MKKVQEYRERASQCRELSELGPNAEIREHYRNLADMWDKMAGERLTFFVPKDLDEAG